ncbi:PREDICTED: ferric-chelate reductase 1-like [Priapulus caudatus]|uniref:Ferric-chelate reductase 1-like n=1 Tax=Priapulus caudatus TaxID=37621 RepID=A0ABM1E7A0_PRICU|nr:PREDICTED: ferric-chelate reductase 1-like [Priapulus caudatus]
MSGIVDSPLTFQPTSPFGSRTDTSMGNDSVIECVHNIDTGTVDIYMSYNAATGKSNSRLARPKDGVILQSSSYNGGIIRCRFLRAKSVSGNNLVFDLNHPWHLLMANGEAYTGGLHMHSLAPPPTSSKEKVNLLATDIGGGGQDNTAALRKAHAALMVIGWVFFVSLGKLTARYYKNTWDTKLFELHLWFQIHRTCMVTAWICFVISTIIIIYAVGGWVTSSDAAYTHSIVGIIAVCLGFVQPFIALCRCHPGTSSRPWFNWIHWGVGTVAHILAVVAIFLAIAFLHGNDAMPFYLFCIMGAFILWHVFVEIILEIHACIVYRKQKKTEVQMRPVNQGTFTMTVERPRPKGSAFQKLMMFLYVIVSFILTVIIVVLLMVKWGSTY